ncbi:MAG: hypothetical protein EXR98_08375 [Gemmataceae bacterium]|nr:hypothetical protein [Gemmataceae bacterium]
MALPMFVITLFVSAFLLFLVQPMIGKLILPKLGGTPQVWNTCMVFFQSVLLLGYAYTHTVSTRLKLRKQLMLHSALLAVPVVMLLIFPFYDTVRLWDPPTEGNPIWATLWILAIVVGTPFFVVSTSAPLLQRWFAYSGDPSAKDPYFLYGASNLGSLLSLFFYPVLIEPMTVLSSQTTIWFVGYVLLGGLVVYCAYMIYKVAPPDEVLAAEAAFANAPPPPAEVPEAVASAPVPAQSVAASTAVKSGPAPGGRSAQRKKGLKTPGKPDEPKTIEKAPIAPIVLTGATAEMTAWRRIRWVMLAAVPSSMMLGVTNYVSTDLSPFVYVWVVPLALYLLSFILVFMKMWTGKHVVTFASTGYTPHQIMLYVGQPLGLIVICFIVMKGGFDPLLPTVAVMLGFFATALACHGEMAVDRPNPRYLTEFFLLMSFGGMLGGLFNAIVAPVVFQEGVLEFYIAIIIACVVRPQYVASGWFDELILNAFPGFQGWVRNQGDEMAKSLGRTPPRTTYMFNIFLDIIFGLFILSIAYWTTSTLSPYYEDSAATLHKVMSFLKLPMTKAWEGIAANVFIMFIPMVFCFFFAGRPLRISLAVMGLLLGNMYYASRDTRGFLEARRTYFGLLKVMEHREFCHDEEENRDFNNKEDPWSAEGKPFAPPYYFTYLMHGTTYHGRNYYAVYSKDKLQKHRLDLSRLATTYYHRYGPVGAVMERDNWFTVPGGATTDIKGGLGAGKQNTFYADMRMPASLIGQMTASLGVGQIPMAALVDTWSEPPFATIGLGTGTMASYARPYQFMTYYEIDEVIREFSLPEVMTPEGPVPSGADGRFTYLQNAIRRGVNLEVLMGDARQSLEREPKRDPLNYKGSLVYYGEYGADKTVVMKSKKGSPSPRRDKFFKAINVDAFSSDAIPIHLVTKQAIQLYMDRLTDDGVLCVHTSNRHMDLVRPVARIAMELSKESQEKGGPVINCMVGKDLGEKERYMGHFTSEYVMIYRGDGFTKTLERNEKQKKDFIQSKTMKPMPVRDERERPQMGRAPDGWQILNSNVEWYDPYKDHGETRRVGGEYTYVKMPVTEKDSVWTDDYSHILSVVRWHWPWQ